MSKYGFVSICIGMKYTCVFQDDIALHYCRTGTPVEGQHLGCCFEQVTLACFLLFCIVNACSRFWMFFIYPEESKCLMVLEEQKQAIRQADCLNGMIVTD